MDKHNLFCNDCGDTGWVVAFKKTDMSQYGFRCGRCKKAEWQKLSNSIPAWTQSTMADFTTVFKAIERENNDKTS